MTPRWFDKQSTGRNEPNQSAPGKVSQGAITVLMGQWCATTIHRDRGLMLGELGTWLL